MLLDAKATSRNETIPQLLNELKGMIFNFARKWDLEFDDCLQDAALIMLETWPRIPVECRNIGAYLNRTVRGELYRRLRRENTLSLDAPITPDSTETFADMLAAYVVVQDEKREDFVTACVHAGLKDCRLQEQQYARERFGLNAFNPVPSDLPDITYYQRSNMSMKNSIKLRLGRNPQVLALMS
ncbi:MAG TPA: sigma factor [Ktedonobacteraceae bacterium]|nr:sigma factor [Ktedonobacteraceae bacterium]